MFVGGGSPSSQAMNMLVYRSLLSFGSRKSQNVENARPAVSLSVTHSE